MTPEQINEIKANLDQFTVTQEYHRWSILFKKHLLTDGAKYLADKLNCYWLMDAVASWHGEAMKHEALREMQVWKLTVKGSKALLVCEDGNDNKILQQKIPYTDFLLNEITLWVQPCEDKFVIFLPNEY
jgi:hypothetical protein